MYGLKTIFLALIIGGVLFIISLALYLTGKKSILTWIFAIICLPVSITWLGSSAGIIVDVIKVL